VSDPGRERAGGGADDAVAQAAALLRQLEELEPRLAAAGSGEVELTLLERATELVEETCRLLERLGRITG
jgi:hypothetical protein